MWPLGRPENAHEIPMWQDVCSAWVDNVMRPVHVTYLIEELNGSEADPETTRHDIEQAVRASGNWDEVLDRHGWLSCEDLIKQLEAGDRSRLVRLVNLALGGAAADTPADDELFYWIRRSPVWEGDEVVYRDAIVAWSWLLDGNAVRAAADEEALHDTGTHTEYVLGSVIWSERHKQLEFTDPDASGMEELLGLKALDSLPLELFVRPETAFEQCGQAVTAWIISEWLAPHGFVNLDANEWHSSASAFEVGKDYDLEDEVSRNAISQWYIVSETAGEQLRLVGEVVVPIPRSSCLLWGRDEGGQMVHMDGAVHRAMVASGHCDHMPPLGALNRNEHLLPRALRFTLGGEEFPFRISGYSENRPNREIEQTLLEPFYQEAGWRVEWGPEFMSEKDGYVRTFRLTNTPAETLGPDVGTYFALVRSDRGEHWKISLRLVEAGSEGEARVAAVEAEAGSDIGEFSGEWKRSVRFLALLDPEDAEKLRKSFSGK